MELNYKLKVLTGVFFLFISIHSHALDSLRLEKKRGKIYVIHQVEKGETLYSISRRYAAGIEDIVRENDIIDNQLALGQELKVPIKKRLISEPANNTVTRHTVKTKETLYSLSRLYGVTIEQLKAWNGLPSNEIAIGQQLIVSNAGMEESEDVSAVTEYAEEPAAAEEELSIPVKKTTIENPPSSSDPNAGFATYYVQNGDLLESIARKFEVRPDSIVIWNNLSNTYLSIGQKLKIRGDLNAVALGNPSDVKVLPYGTIRKRTDASGFTRVFEEGVASKIDSSVETEKYLALHRTLPIGTLIEVRNLMNNQKVFVRVVGYLPETGLNEKVLVRLTPICFERLGVIDPKTRVELSYYLD